MLSKIKYHLTLIFYRYILNKDTMGVSVKYYRKHGVKIGENMRAFSPLLSAEPYLLEFGDNITVSRGVSFVTHDNSAGKIITGVTDIIGRIKIGNNCFIGTHSIIMPGVELTDNVIVGAGSVVTKSILTEGVIIAGNPAKVIGNFKDYKGKYENMAFNTKGLSFNEKKTLILSNESKLIKK